jgi:hypothetical protein
LFLLLFASGAPSPLGTSALVQYGPAPTHLVWWLLLGAFAVTAVAVLAIPETAARRPGVLAALRPRVAVPRQARGTFAVTLPCLIAAPALAGFYLSLGPSLTAQVCGASRTTDSASWPGGLPPGPGAGETPLPEVRKIRPGPSDTSPPLLCQMPAWLLVTPASSVHSVELALLARSTAATYPA